MTTENGIITLDDIVQIINECTMDGATLPETDLTNINFREDLDLDSLDLINVFFKLEQLSGVQITSDDLNQYNLMIIGNLVSHINASK